VAAALAAAATGALAPGALGAKVTLTTSTGFPDATTAVDYDRYYSSATTNDPTGFCPAGAVPLTVGWKGAGVFVARIDARTGGRGYFTLDTRDTWIAASTRAVSRCARGPVAATVKKRSGSGVVSCGAKLALGLPFTASGPYQDGAASSAPAGINRWRSTMSGSDATALCVTRSAFGAVKVVKKSGTFAAGAQAATVATACPRGHRAISWGVDLPLMEGNAYQPSGITNRRTTPWVSASAPTGNGWTVTFRTADARPAAAPATLTTYVTCAVPA
jgi:hypothetical protein